MDKYQKTVHNVISTVKRTKRQDVVENNIQSGAEGSGI